MKAELLELLPALRRFAWSLTQSVHDADDLLQATVERLLKKGVPDGVELARWAFTVCRNLWIDEYRSRKIRRNVDVEPEVYEAGQVDGESDVHSQMELERVMAAIKHLPEDQQTVLTMVAIQGLPYQQVADELEIPIGTVMSRLSRARARLASSLQLTN
ncbi:RNA polymerase sigma factor [Pseudohongiella sp. SYSU M77423]|uniref:RNA polymerase sigma factor n=1 Tax=unclassified Pseudohongiella TaxID=2629611 RepID=UPI000C94CE7F|nr:MULTISPECIES: RNA polymerase sigma factor [unclassified Pseudohongiella]MAO40252.1 RNA polymerase subunit sigma-70 [Pseudohongiella sp.]MAY55426.1 RNA polymerase subunit sigma-70 [Gammaproteobacteria bacterium]MEC8860504.1 RNA polymerase sigma factor [Pseudomonadota bacterium]MDH7942768.1 RNA polymerase sigma factor [Pseudohongiella sp. SYSU M77423]HBN14859.1 RNA polymerase subunit sigma-70 [Pseudohongiella sp.]|tara:strand:+ start:43 stop:519 length:477 start_codon:yes stop_codon:yes gene_type:complete